MKAASSVTPPTAAPPQSLAIRSSNLSCHLRSKRGEQSPRFISRKNNPLFRFSPIANAAATQFLTLLLRCHRTRDPIKLEGHPAAALLRLLILLLNLTCHPERSPACFCFSAGF